MHEHPMSESARDFAHMETTGAVRDSVYLADGDDDPEISTLVVNNYDEENQSHHDRSLRYRIEALESTLRNYGIEIPD